MPPKKPTTSKGYKMAEELPKGTSFTDIFKTKWSIVHKVGVGGFGLIYSVCQCDANGKTSKDDFVAKIEPKNNGPLFTEINFYARVCKEEMLNEFKKLRSLTHLGVPRYISSGICQDSYRYLIMDRYDADLHRIMREHPIKCSTLIKLTIQILEAVEYLHSKGYVHADVKAMNILRGRGSNTNVFLVDFGLAHLYNPNGVHREEKVDPKVKHDGTIEYCSTDSHQGLPPSRRSDLEIIFFNLLDWLSQYRIYSVTGALQEPCYALPWFVNILKVHQHARHDRLLPLSVKEQVAGSKAAAVAQPEALLKEVLQLSEREKDDWKGLLAFICDVKKLSYTEEPNYQRLQAHLCALAQCVGEKGGQPLKPYCAKQLDWKDLQLLEVRSPQKSRKRVSGEGGGESSSHAAKRPALKSAQPVSRAKKTVKKKAEESSNNNCNDIIPGAAVQQAESSSSKISKFPKVSKNQIGKEPNDIIPGLKYWSKKTDQTPAKSQSASINGVADLHSMTSIRKHPVKKVLSAANRPQGSEKAIIDLPTDPKTPAGEDFTPTDESRLSIRTRTRSAICQTSPELLLNAQKSAKLMKKN